MKRRVLISIFSLAICFVSASAVRTAKAQTYPTPETVKEYPTIEVSTAPLEGSYYEGTSSAENSRGETPKSTPSIPAKTKDPAPTSRAASANFQPVASKVPVTAVVDPNDITAPEPKAETVPETISVETGAAIVVPEGAQPYDPYQYATPVSSPVEQSGTTLSQRPEGAQDFDPYEYATPVERPASPASQGDPVIVPGYSYEPRPAKTGPGTQLDGSIHVFLVGDAVVDPATLKNFYAKVTITADDGSSASQVWQLDPSQLTMDPGGLTGGIDLMIFPEYNGAHMTMQFYGITKDGKEIGMGNAVDFEVEMTPQDQRTVVIPDIVDIQKDSKGNLIGIFDPLAKTIDRAWVKSFWALITDTAGNKVNVQLNKYMISADGRSVILPDIDYENIASIKFFAVEYGGGFTNHSK